MVRHGIIILENKLKKELLIMRNINVKLSELKIDSNNYIYGFTKQTILEMNI
jgi:hypothetical protein